MVTLEKFFPKEKIKDEKVLHHIRERLYAKGIGSELNLHKEKTYILRYFPKDETNYNVEALVKVVNQIIEEEFNK